VKITFVRHGNTGKAERDEDRRLSEKGREQARNFKAKYRVTPHLVLSSSAQRALETALVIVEGQECPIKVLTELYLAVGDIEVEIINALFAVHGYAPLATYIEADPGFFERYAKRAAAVIRELAEAAGANDIMVVGHAILLNVIGLEFSSDPRLLTTTIGETQGFTIDTDGWLDFL
jgi:broad specificity phosphatase PhoE